MDLKMELVNKKTEPGYIGQCNNSYTIYIGGVYEVNKDSGSNMTGSTTYYPAADAMRVNGRLYYVLRDQLSSASEVLDSSGAVVGEQRYYPFGEVRVSTGSICTVRLYTGQRAIASLGLMDYHARFYDSYITHFSQPNTIIPNEYDPQSLNRYAYARNNPINFNDPSGHLATCDPLDPGPECYRTGDGGGGQIDPKILADDEKKGVGTPGGDTLGGKCGPKSDKVCFDPDAGLCVPGSGCSGDDKGTCSVDPNEVCWNPTHGLCLPGIGCSGGTDYQKWWYEVNLPSLQQEFSQFGKDYHFDAFGFGLGGAVGIYPTAVDGGVEVLYFLKSGEFAIYDYSGPSGTIGAGGNGSLYLILASNLDNAAKYATPFTNVDGVGSFGLPGVKVGYFFGDNTPFKPGTSQGLTIGWAPGARVALSAAQNWFNMIWRTP